MEYFNEIPINIGNSKQLEEDKSNQKFRIKLNLDVTKYKIKAGHVTKFELGGKNLNLWLIFFLCTEEPAKS